VSEHIVRAALPLFPPAFRREAGEELVAIASAAEREARQRGMRALLAAWLRLALDLLLAAHAERRGNRPRIIESRQRPVILALPRRPRARRPQTRRLEALAHDLRDGARGLLRSPALVAVVTLTLMLGIGANTLIFSLVDQLLLRPLPIERPDRVVRVFTSDWSSGRLGTSSYPDYQDFREQSTALADLAAFTTVEVNVEVNGGDNTGLEVGSEATSLLTAELVSDGYFNLLGVRPYLGSFFATGGATAPQRLGTVVLSFGAWRQHCAGNPDIVGRKVNINGEPFVVLGVSSSGFRGVDGRSPADLWLPIESWAAALPQAAMSDPLAARGTRWLALVGRLRDNTSLESAQAELQSAMDRLATTYPETNLGTALRPDHARPITVLSALEGRLGNARASVVEISRLLAILVAVVLLVSCVNVANLLIQRGVERRGELALRLALGAGRGRVVQQLVLESLLLAILGGAAGLCFTALLFQVVANDLLPAVSGPLAIGAFALDLRLLTFTVAVSLVCAVGFGLAPALHLVRDQNLAPALQNRNRSPRGRWRRIGVSDGLVVVQVGGACLLLVLTALLGRSLVDLVRADLGFDPERVVLASISPARHGYEPAAALELYRELIDRLETRPEIEAASLAAYVPVDAAGARRSFVIEGHQPQPGESTETNLNWVTAGYFDTLRIPLLRGRLFEGSDRAEAPRVAIVNRTFAERFWPGDTALGKRLGRTGREIEVVGVVADSKYRSVQEEPLPYVYLPLLQDYRPQGRLAVRGRSIAGDELISILQRVAHDLDHELRLFEVETLDQHVGNALATERSLTTLIAGFSATTLLLAAVGLYGLLSAAVARRQREYGIRCALGASRERLLRSVVGSGLLLTTAGMIVGIAAAAGLARLLASRLFGISPWDALSFASAGFLLIVTAACATLPPARRASRVDPAATLRGE
jgi:predicted permease